MFDRKVFLLFEEEGMMVETYIGTDVNEAQMMKVMESLSLEQTSEENASLTTDYDQALLNNVNEAREVNVIPLKKYSKQLFSVGQTIPVTMGNSKLEYVIEIVEVFDSIIAFKQENFNDFGLEKLSENKALDQTKTLIPYKRDVYKLGNGKDSIDVLVGSQFVKPKFIYLTTTVKN